MCHGRPCPAVRFSSPGAFATPLSHFPQGITLSACVPVWYHAGPQSVGPMVAQSTAKGKNMTDEPQEPQVPAEEPQAPEAPAEAPAAPCAEPEAPAE